MPILSKHIKIASEKENLSILRSQLMSYFSEYPISEVELNLLIVAIDEICANVILHANKDDEAPFIDIDLTLEKDGLTVKIFDQGKKFNILSQQENTIESLVEKRRKGGMGIMLIKRIMDKIEYYRENNYNVHRMYKKLHTPVRFN